MVKAKLFYFLFQVRHGSFMTGDGNSPCGGIYAHRLRMYKKAMPIERQTMKRVQGALPLNQDDYHHSPGV